MVMQHFLGGWGSGGVNKVPYGLCEIGEIEGVLSLGRTAHLVFIPNSLTDSVSRK